MTNWHSYTIGDLVAENIIAPPVDGNHGEIHPKGNDFISSGIPFVMASDINNGTIDFERCQYISKDQAEGLRKGFSEEDDVLLSHKATIGRTAIVPKSSFPYLMLTPQVTYYRVLDKDKLDNRFLKYQFDDATFQKTLGLWAGAGSTRAYLGIIGQKSLPLRIPDINTQKEIANVLSVLDEKIEVNNKTNTELEAMANLIYDYWFVQFDFPDEHGKPYKSSGGKMIYSEELKRDIPDGWNSATVEEILANESQKTKLPKTKYQEKGHYPIIDQSTKFICGYTDNKETLIEVKSPRIVFGDHTRILKLVKFDFARGADGTQVLSSGEERVPPHFFYHSLLKIDLSNYGYARHFKFLKDTRITVPKKEIAIKFEDIVSTFHDQIKHNIFETKELEELRDWLLPMLMNGQVTIK
jgi:type I restriction enzyme S subunit